MYLVYVLILLTYIFQYNQNWPQQIKNYILLMFLYKLTRYRSLLQNYYLVDLLLGIIISINILLIFLFKGFLHVEFLPMLYRSESPKHSKKKSSIKDKKKEKDRHKRRRSSSSSEDTSSSALSDSSDSSR